MMNIGLGMKEGKLTSGCLKSVKRKGETKYYLVVIRWENGWGGSGGYKQIFFDAYA
jgi:hypothetical protein